MFEPEGGPLSVFYANLGAIERVDRDMSGALGAPTIVLTPDANETFEDPWVVELDGVRRTVSLMLLPEAEVGQHLLIHAGYAIGSVNEEEAEKTLESVLKEMDIDFYFGEGEAAFYGPKVDIQFVNLMGREETVSTIQLDFQMPERFDLSYVDSDGNEKRPVMIHRAPFGSM